MALLTGVGDNWGGCPGRPARRRGTHQASLGPHEIGLASTEYLVCRFVTFSRNLEHLSFITEVPYVDKLC